jgi:hypothetical protein
MLNPETLDSTSLSFPVYLNLVSGIPPFGLLPSMACPRNRNLLGELGVTSIAIDSLNVKC